MREVGEKGIITSLLFRLLLGIAMVLPNQSSRRALFSMIHKQLGGNIKMWLSGAAPLDPHVLKGFDLFGIPIYQGYGMTEASPVITCSSPRRNRIGAVGPALPKVEIKIDKESSEIIVRGPNVMKGYYKRPDLTAEAIKDGWLYTGDVGYLDRDGFLFVTGRLKDVIVTASGKNIYPQDLEMMFSRIKGIKEVCVLGVRIKKGVGVGGEEAGMIIIPDLKYFETEKVQDQTRIEKILKKQVANLNASLPMYQRVGRIKFRYQDFPKTTTRKIKRKELIKEVGEF
jgi:long-chain acyl-CoA synthetase